LACDRISPGGASVCVPQRKVLNQLLAAGPELELLGPFGNNDAGTDVIRVCQVMLVPFCYVQLFLQRPLTPREAWVQVAGAIYNNGNQIACEPLLDWLRVTITRQGEDLASRLQQEHPRAPLMLPDLVQHHWQLVITDLPALSSGATMAAGHVITSSLNALVADTVTRMKRAANRIVRALRRSVSVAPEC
jgi:hypothetical protein